MDKVKLTEYSHGAGCGCKIAPAVLRELLGPIAASTGHPKLLVGNAESDDAAVYDLDGATSIVSTTDFFMPIVDDAFDFGAIAATNALSDIYAMGGEPIMAIAIFGWPLDKLPIEVGSRVLAGGRSVCDRAGIALAGGHSIDSPEPIFGLAVTGKVSSAHIKRNSTAQDGDYLYLTKPIGIGMVTTAQKKGLARPEDLLMAKESMLRLNDIGTKLAARPEVHAMTDVTGFGLGGHLLEMCRGAGLGAVVEIDQVPRFSFVDHYFDLSCHPGGTARNWASYGKEIELEDEAQRFLMADPQTSGGLLIAVEAAAREEFESWMSDQGHSLNPLGHMHSGLDGIEVR